MTDRARHSHPILAGFVLVGMGVLAWVAILWRLGVL